MKPIATGLDVLQGEQHVCIGYLLPTITAINKALNEFNNLNFCRPLVHALKNGLTKRYFYKFFKFLLYSLELNEK